LDSIFQIPIKEGSTLLCAICMTVQNGPQRLPCEHVFCKKCVLQLCKLEMPCCPLDRIAFQQNQVIPDRVLNNVILERDIYCLYRKKSCDWKGELGELQPHLQYNCPFAPIRCKYAPMGCLMMIQRNQETEHMDSNCAYHLQLTTALLEKYILRDAEREKQLQKLELNVQVLTKQLQNIAIGIQPGSLKDVVEEINQTIFGPKGGAKMYDRGNMKGCYELYKGLAEKLIAREESTEHLEFWVAILQKAIELSEKEASSIPFGKQNDAAWTLRKGFEAIKLGAHNRKVYSNPDCVVFWKRIADTHGFLDLAK